MHIYDAIRTAEAKAAKYASDSDENKRLASYLRELVEARSILREVYDENACDSKNLKRIERLLNSVKPAENVVFDDDEGNDAAVLAEISDADWKAAADWASKVMEPSLAAVKPEDIRDEVPSPDRIGKFNGQCRHGIAIGRPCVACKRF
jgi:hypothetical protein